jgi:hypothetical protein
VALAAHGLAPAALEDGMDSRDTAAALPREIIGRPTAPTRSSSAPTAWPSR